MCSTLNVRNGIQQQTHLRTSSKRDAAATLPVAHFLSVCVGGPVPSALTTRTYQVFSTTSRKRGGQEEEEEE